MEENRPTRMMCPWLRYACDEGDCVCWNDTLKICKRVLLINAQLALTTAQLREM